jgi:hypothetical protein
VGPNGAPRTFKVSFEDAAQRLGLALDEFRAACDRREVYDLGVVAVGRACVVIQERPLKSPQRRTPEERRAEERAAAALAAARSWSPPRRPRAPLPPETIRQIQQALSRRGGKPGVKHPHITPYDPSQENEIVRLAARFG